MAATVVGSAALEVTAEICRGPRGALGLFRGLAAPLVGYSIEAGINYTAFSQGRRWREHNNPFVVGAGAVPSAGWLHGGSHGAFCFALCLLGFLLAALHI